MSAWHHHGEYDTYAYVVSDSLHSALHASGAIVGLVGVSPAVSVTHGVKPSPAAPTRSVGKTACSGSQLP
jgi:hypothetical protein